MTVVFKTKSCKIEKLKNKNFKLFFSDGEKYKKYLEYCKIGLKIVEKKKNYFVFEADDVISLKDFLKKANGYLKYKYLKLLFLDVGKQLDGLEKDNYGSLFIEEDDIAFIDIMGHESRKKDIYNMKFMYLNSSNFLPIKKKEAEIKLPFDKKNKYLSPEMMKVKSFPVKVPVNNIYYSLSMLVGNCLMPIKKHLSYDQYKIHIESILGTKLYWSLLRAFENKIYLYI